MRYLSVCSGIEAASVAWPMWEAVGFSEIEPFPSAVLSHHYPIVPNFGDMTRYREWEIGAIDLLVGGTPCQSFSVAGLRKGLEDPRGNLMLVYCGILDWFKPRWFVWENVPGVLSSNGGRDFGAFLGAVAELGYGWAYRVLDAQYFGVAQRRRRVFVVGCFGDWASAAKVLFEPESLSGNPAPRKEAGKEVAPCVTNGPPFSRTGNERVETEAMVVQPVANCLTQRMHKGINTTLDEGQTPVLQAVSIQDVRAVNKAQNGKGWNDDGTAYTVDTHATQGVAQAMQVRRLTPVECERLQGFPDGYTNIPWRGKPESPDGPRYKALGNSMAVPVMKWIGERMDNAEKERQ